MTGAGERYQSTSGRPLRLPGWAGFSMALALFWLGGQFLTQGVSDELSQRSPELASLWRGDSADAVSGLARARLLAGDNSGAARLARRVLLHAPLNSAAVATYGVAQARLGHAQIAQQAMQAAGGLGWRDLVVQISLLRTSLLNAKAGQAVLHLDAIMRREDPVPPALLNIVELIAQDRAARQAIVARLAMNPDWRAPLFAFLAKDGRPNAVVVYGQFLRMLEPTAHPPTAEEVSPYLIRLAMKGGFADAQSAWRELLHVNATTLVHNGDFASTPDGTPFDWSIYNGESWSAQIDQSPGPGGGMALHVRYDGVSDAPPAQELVILKPGRYRLSFVEQDDQGEPARALSWTVTCAGSGQVIDRPPASAAAGGAWQAVADVFTVPAAGCDAQWLGVSAQKGERPETSARWYRQVAITPLAAADDSPHP